MQNVEVSGAVRHIYIYIYIYIYVIRRLKVNVCMMSHMKFCFHRLPSNKLEHWYVRHNNVYYLHLWATCFNLYKGHLEALLYM